MGNNEAQKRLALHQCSVEAIRSVPLRGKQPLGEQASQIVTNFVFAFQGCFDMRQELLKLAWVNPVFMAEPSNRADRRRTQRDGHVASSGGDRPQYKTIIISAVVPLWEQFSHSSFLPSSIYSGAISRIRLSLRSTKLLLLSLGTLEI